MVIVGSVLGSYRILGQIGAGGMGIVWLAEHQVLGSRAAIKVLLPEMSAQPKMVDRFFSEARAATRIQDPGIVTVLDFGWHDGSAFIVMEHLRGESLTARLGIGRLPPLQALRIVQQCAIAMAAAHARGIIHRDLKPDNVFVVPDPAVIGGERIKILDFGIAKLLDDHGDPAHQHTVTGTIMGTPAFMSPEQCRGASEIDHRTDIYALGCVLFNLLCGRPPFIAPTPGDMIVAHIQQDPPLPSSLVAGLSPAVDSVVLNCLAKNPDARYSSMTELARAAGEITGENRSIATLPPLRATQAGIGQQTVGTLTPAPHNTTLNASTGETSSEPPRARRTWPIVFASMVIAVGVTVAVATSMSSSKQASTAPPAPPPPVPAATPDAGAIAVDAALAIDAATRPDAGGATIPKKQPKQPKLPATGSASGSGSGSAKVDPYLTR